MPRADNLPNFSFTTRNVPCKANPLGVKGAGEAGAVGAPPALINAIVDALHHRGVRHVDMPATPSRVWQALHAAGGFSFSSRRRELIRFSPLCPAANREEFLCGGGFSRR